ncbi:MAG TPA: TIGR00730 family Rossman fold protein, partial [Ilumatobacteraceae bacterium]|nr:TIGR00730 family Rossman fold protein [Ilumatobacteraceae bacterium]
LWWHDGAMAALCVFCGSSSGNDRRYVEAAQSLGRLLAAEEHTLVYGGGHVGLMGAVADAALVAGGHVIGVMTEQLVAAEVAHLGLTRLEVVTSMHERKARMAELSDGVIVLPGGFGTLDEAFEIITWNQLGLVAAPVVFLDVLGYFESLFAFIDRSVAEGFVGQARLAQRAASVREAVRIATSPAAPYAPKWLG